MLVPLGWFISICVDLFSDARLRYFLWVGSFCWFVRVGSVRFIGLSWFVWFGSFRSV